MNHKYIIESERLILKPLVEENIEDLRLLRNREKKYFYSQEDISYESQLQWFANYQKKENDIMFSIFKKDSPNNYIGSIALYDINKIDKNAEFGRIVIDKKKCTDKGIGAEAIKALINFAFFSLDLETIIATAKLDNSKAIKVYKKIGFIERGKINKLNACLFEIRKDNIS